jgi:hypothetical protein
MLRSQQAAAPVSTVIPSFEQQAPAPEGEKEKRSAGPGKWNEFLDRYVAEQAAKGISIRKHNAKMDPNVRRLYYSLNGRQPPAKKIRSSPIVRNETRRVTPPFVPLPVPAEPEEEVQQTPLQAVTSFLTGVPANRQPTPSNRQPTPQPTPKNRQPTPQPTPSNRQPTPPPTPNNRQPTPQPTPSNRQATPSYTNSRNFSNSKPSPATYGYEDLGVNAESSARKIRVRVDDEPQDFFLDSDMGLYEREGDDYGRWIGYLEPGGRIRYTDQPDA